MTTDQVQAIGPEFTAFLRPFERFFDEPETVRHFRNYSRGLLTDLPRKTAEPLAKFAGTPPRCLQQFLKACLWDHVGLTDGVQHTLRARVAELPPDPVGTVGVIDETSALKKGTKTPGVQRQYLGCVGKVANGIVTVHVVVAHGQFKALLDSELFLPESWDADRDRCREADIPDDVHYRPKSEIALEVLARTERNGWQFDWLTFDEWYGGKPGFLRVLDVAAVRYVGEVPKSFSCRPGRSRIAARRRGHICSAGREETGSEVVPHRATNRPGGGVAGEGRGRGLGGQRSAATPPDPGAESGDGGDQVLPHQRTPAGSACARAAGARSVPLVRMWSMCSASPRAKSGLTHFEGRSYVSLKRHLALCLVALAFVSLHTMQLWGEKSADHPGTSLPNSGSRLSEVSEPPTSHERNGMPGRPPPVPATAKRGRLQVTEETTAKT